MNQRGAKPLSWQPSVGPLIVWYAEHPKVRFKPLPFYDTLYALHEPATLIPNDNVGGPQENNYVFSFAPQHVCDIVSSKGIFTGSLAEYAVQVQLRFCRLKASYELDDAYPPDMCVKVNDQLCPLPDPIPTKKPGEQLKRPGRPLSIVSLCHLSSATPNRISVTWTYSKFGPVYALAVYLVRKLSPATLLERLKVTALGNPVYTTNEIKLMLRQDPDCQISTTTLRWSLMCPLSKMRMATPCRAMTCSHLQCFDLLFFLQMNERKPTWICPVCGKPAPFSMLLIDGLFKEVAEKAPRDCCEVQFHEDGSWSPLLANETHGNNRPSSSIASTSSCAAPLATSPGKQSGQPSKRPRLVVIDLTECSSDEEAGGGNPDANPQAGPNRMQPRRGGRRQGPSSVPAPGAHLGVPHR
ncbi:E3 SUMO-protein ligase PIAS2-like [Haemaphysalis longicornis]